MHTLKLNIKDNVFDKVVYFLNNLPKDDVIIVEDKIIFDKDISETQAFSNHTVNLIDEWKDDSEDDVWK